MIRMHRFTAARYQKKAPSVRLVIYPCTKNKSVTHTTSFGIDAPISTESSNTSFRRRLIAILCLPLFLRRNMPAMTRPPLQLLDGGGTAAEMSGWIPSRDPLFERRAQEVEDMRFVLSIPRHVAVLLSSLCAYVGLLADAAPRTAVTRRRRQWHTHAQDSQSSALPMPRRLGMCPTRTGTLIGLSPR